jgi:3-dehydroquinate synthase
MESIRVGLGERSYDIMIGSGTLRDLGQELRERGLARDAMVFTSPRIGGLYFDRLRAGLEEAGVGEIRRHDIPDGEKYKNVEEWEKACAALVDLAGALQASPLVVNLGGGVVGDLGGFVAGTVRRGVPFVMVTTTLLADVDCGVGGKVGVDFHGAKNVMGMYHQPSLVYVDLDLLKTLDPREVRSGVAEVIKYGAVCSRDLFEFLEKNIEGVVSLEKPVLQRVVRECCRIKAEVVRRDERDDRGARVVLNFGHTVGHAMERAMEWSPELTHGEAVAVGMIAATRLGIRLGTCGEAVLERIEALIRRAGLPASAADLGIGPDEVLEAMRHDKKFVGGMNRFVLPVELGDWCERQDVPQALVREVVESCVASK